MAFRYRQAAILLALCLCACAHAENGSFTPQAGDAGASLAAIPSDRAASWPMFAHDFRRSGVQRVASGITPQNVKQLRLRWYFNAGKGRFVGGPVVADGVVYVADTTGTVRALSAATGSVIWTYRLGGTVWMTPFLYDGVLYVGTHTLAGELAAIDAKTGTLRWEQMLPGSLRSAPVIVHGELYVGVAFGDPPACRGGGIYLFNAKTGEPGPTWLTDPGAQPDGGGVWGPISFDGSRLFFGTGNACTENEAQANAIVAMSPAATALWHVQTAPSYRDLDVAGGVLVHGQRGYVVGKNGIFYALDLATGRVIWNVQLNHTQGDGGFSSPILVDDTLIVSNGYDVRRAPVAPAVKTGEIVGIAPTGHVRWTIELAHPMTGSASAIPGLAFLALDNSIVAIDPSTGQVVWRYVTQGAFGASSPAISPDGLFAADFRGYVYAFGLDASNAKRSARRALPPVRFETSIRDLPAPPPYCKLPAS